MALAQYELHEVGIAPGLGVNLPLGNSRTLPLGTVGLQAFYSHFVCGKAYGYHATLGVRLDNYLEAATDEVGRSLRFEAPTPQGSLHFLWLEPGVYFKVRGHKQHKQSEISFLIGLKAQVRMVAFSTGQPEPGLLNNNDWRTVAIASAVPHFSAWIRRPISRKRALFLNPGVEGQVYPSIQTGGRPSLYGLYFFLNAGILLWENR
jgi:hypothetical protein